MKVWVYERYGPPEVLQLRDVPRPEPGADEILVRARATPVTAGDHRLRAFDIPPGFKLMTRLMFGVFRPRKRVLGTVLAGDVEAIGRNVSRFQVGDPVVLYDDGGMACHAEYKCISEKRPVVVKPEGLSWAQAAAIPFGFTTALHFFRTGQLKDGERVLVNGASGAVGSSAVQLAKHFGAEVTGVSSAANHELVRSLGADHVIDYKTQDFTANGERYDVIVDTVGTALFKRSKGSLTDRGRLLVVSGTLPEMLRAPWVRLTSKKKVFAGVAFGSTEALTELLELAQAGKIAPVIEREYGFDAMIEAHRHVDTGHKRGSVVVTFEG